MASRYRFVSCHATQRTMLDPNLRFSDPVWSWVVGGNGSLTGTIAIPEDPNLVERLKAATTELTAAIYVQDQEGQYTWGGPVIKTSRVPGKSQITVTCMEWRAWPFAIMYLPTGDIDNLFLASPPSGEDQLSLARRLFDLATGGGGSDGCPPYTQDGNLSGKLRELTFYSTQGKRVGESLDTMGRRDGGFEWTLDSRPDPTDGLPRLHLLLSYPEHGTLVDGLKFKATPGGSNFTPDAIERDASSAYNQFLATGSGTPPDMLFAVDFASTLADNTALRMDGSASYNTVTERSTLAAHARRAIQFYQSGIQTIKGTHTFGEINPDSYVIGDRGSLLVQDRWETIALDAVRVVEKQISLAAAGSVSFVLDLSDATLPEVDAGGVI